MRVGGDVLHQAPQLGRPMLRGPVRGDAEAIYRLASDVNVAGMLSTMPQQARSLVTHIPLRV